MKQRDLLLLAVLPSLALASAAPVAAQPAAKPYRVGILCPVACETSDVRIFREALAASGYKEGSNVVFTYRSAAGDLKRLPALADELLQHGTDLIYTTFGTFAGLAAKEATTSTPVVVGSAGDLVAAGIVNSLSHPGGNVTGITSLALELESKRLEFLKELLPTVSRIAFFRDTTNPYSVLAVKLQRAAAAELGVELREIQVHEAADVDQAFAAIVEDRIMAVCVDSYIPLLASRDHIVEVAARDRVAAAYPFKHFVEAGGLLSYGSSLEDNARRAAVLVGKILAGAKPADLPVEQSTKVELVINLKTAKTMGLVIPPALLARADEVID
jgi:putative ABC transport system substrate-binding protein